MCGIAGFLALERAGEAPELESTAITMADALRHRGPDDAGAWVDPEAGVALGFRRLSIIDLSAEGHQPMLSACGRYVVAFNGEIYNFRALRAELRPRGHRFRGRSDTEIMLAAISEWGLEAALPRFVGMFAFALWDRGRRTLSLVRDRLGIKPLYYGRVGRRFLFGSELKAMRSHPSFGADLDRGALAAYMRHGYVPAPRTIHEGCFKLPPGTVLRVSREEGAVGEPEPYWSAREIALRGVADPLEVTPEDAEEALDSLLRDSVRLRLESDVPLGAFLSGGIDSSTVVALMQAESSRPVRTFTIGFREPGYDEASHARGIAEHLRTEHTELYAAPAEALDLIPRIPEWYDEPFADSSQLPTYLVARMTRSHVTVALSGDGGDELFAGYDRYFWAESIWSVIGTIPEAWRGRLAGFLTRLSPAAIDRIAAFLPGRSSSPRPAGSAQRLASTLRLDSVDALYRRLLSLWEEPSRLVVGATEAKGILWDESVARDLPQFIPRAQLLDLLTYLPDDILTKVDRATMAVGLEARVPLLDHRVVELALRLPFSLKVRNGQRKWLLRKVLSRYVPSRLFERPKMGFGVPIDTWLRGPLREWAEDLLDERRLSREGLLDGRLVRQKWDEHLSGRHDWHYPLWNVLMFEAWKERWG